MSRWSSGKAVLKPFERLRGPELWVRGVPCVCQSLTYAMLLQGLGLRHDACRLPSWKPPRKLLCDGLEGLVWTRESRLFPKLSRICPQAQAPGPKLQSWPACAPSSHEQDHESSGIHNNGSLNHLVQELYLCLTVLCKACTVGSCLCYTAGSEPGVTPSRDVHHSLEELRLRGQHCLPNCSVGTCLCASLLCRWSSNHLHRWHLPLRHDKDRCKPQSLFCSLS